VHLFGNPHCFDRSIARRSHPVRVAPKRPRGETKPAAARCALCRKSQARCARFAPSSRIPFSFDNEVMQILTEGVNGDDGSVEGAHAWRLRLRSHHDLVIHCRDGCRREKEQEQRRADH
jgi:hypothetical protein